MHTEKMWVDCQCSYPSHAIRFSRDEGEPGWEPEFTVDQIVHPSPGFFKRVLLALRFIFRKRPLYLSSTLLELDSLLELRDLLDRSIHDHKSTGPR